VIFRPAICRRAGPGGAIVVSEGNLRALFFLVGRAADSALLRPGSDSKINCADAAEAINDLL